MNEVFFKDLGLRKPDYFLNAAGSNATTTIGQIIINIDPVLEKEKPDAFLVLGDTNSCLCAIPAKKRHIPIFHMEAGNRCFDQRVPEETNRKIVDHISDINLSYSDIAREYLLREGLPPDRIIKTGSPMFEVLNANMQQIDNSDVLSKLSLEKEKYFVVSAHREENINNDKNFFGLINSLNRIAEMYGYPIIVTTHPRTRTRLEQLYITQQQSDNNDNPTTTLTTTTPQPPNLPLTQSPPLSVMLSVVEAPLPPSQIHSLIHLLKPLGFHDYNHLQKNAKVVLSDSGTISEESSIMNFPALNIRDAHERPEAMEEASVMMVGLNTERILQGLVILENQKTGSGQRTLRPVVDYSMPNVSDKVVRIILSYTDYVNRVVWSEK